MLQKYETRDDLMDELADQVASQIEDALRNKGEANIALPGGTTPAPFLDALSQIDLEWDKVNITLSDERFVDETSERSNTRLLKENFLINSAKAARFIPLITSDKSAQDSVNQATAGIDAILPLDVLVTGMGEDMHTASLFPDSPDLQAALSSEAPALMVINAPNAGEPRITLTANALRSALNKHVLITGDAKLKAYQKALNAPSETIAPVRVVLIGDLPAIVHYAP